MYSLVKISNKACFFGIDAENPDVVSACSSSHVARAYNKQSTFLF